jgi:hypothetical protein
VRDIYNSQNAKNSLTGISQLVRVLQPKATLTATIGMTVMTPLKNSSLLQQNSKTTLIGIPQLVLFLNWLHQKKH